MRERGICINVDFLKPRPAGRRISVVSSLYVFSNSLTILAFSFPSFACPERSRRIGRGEGALGMPRALTRGRGYS